MYEVGSTVVNMRNMRQASVCSVIVNENILEEKGWKEPKVEIQYENGLREWVDMSETKRLLIETDPNEADEWLQD